MGIFWKFTVRSGDFHLTKQIRNALYGIFLLPPKTGIAPFRSMIMSNPGLNYQLIHGVRLGNEAYEREFYDSERYLLCTSRDDSGDYRGRLTGYLRETEFDKNSSFYLCGNSDMVFDAMEILKSRGFGRKDINVEVYF